MAVTPCPTCGKWALGPFMTDWRCLLPRDHAKVEGHPHIFEPDIWPGGRHHDAWVAGSLTRPSDASDTRQVR